LTPTQTITVGSNFIGKLYTGGFSNSGATLAAYLSSLGSDKSRYNSDETTIRFTTEIGKGLTAIYRQNPSLNVNATSVPITYGDTPILAANTISGLINGDTLAAVSNLGSATYTLDLSTSGKQKYGSYSITPDITSALSGVGYGFTASNSGTLTVAKKILNMTGGITASPKTYDGTTAASLSVTTPIFTNLETNGGTSDVVSVSATGAFVDKNVSPNKQVNISSTVLSGTDAANYILSNSQSTTNANLSAKALTVTGTTVTSRAYDGTLSAPLVNGTLVGVVGSDAVILTQTGSYADKNIGVSKPVTATDLIGGGGASNYTLTQPTGLVGDITAKAVLAFQKDKVSLSWYERYILKGKLVGLKTRTALNLIFNH
jgi:hypothetical protein